MHYFIKNEYTSLLVEKIWMKKYLQNHQDIYENELKIVNISENQRQYSDKNVYNNINQVLKDLIDEKINLGQKDIIHFVGIGGIGMSGLAQIMKNMGFKIQGSDQTKNKNTISCSRAGIKVFISHNKRNIKSSTIIVRSSAIKNSFNEISYARTKKFQFILELNYLLTLFHLKKILLLQVLMEKQLRLL